MYSGSVYQGSVPQSTTPRPSLGNIHVNANMAGYHQQPLSSGSGGSTNNSVLNHGGPVFPSEGYSTGGYASYYSAPAPPGTAYYPSSYAMQSPKDHPVGMPMPIMVHTTPSTTTNGTPTTNTTPTPQEVNHVYYQGYTKAQGAPITDPNAPRSIYSAPGYFQYTQPQHAPAPSYSVPHGTSVAPYKPTMPAVDRNGKPMAALPLPSQGPHGQTNSANNGQTQYYQLYEPPREGRPPLPTPPPLHANNNPLSPTVSPLSSPMPASTSMTTMTTMSTSGPIYSTHPGHLHQQHQQQQAQQQQQVQQQVQQAQHPQPPPPNQRFSHTLPPLSYVLSGSNPNAPPPGTRRPSMFQGHPGNEHYLMSNGGYNGYMGQDPRLSNASSFEFANRSRNSSHSSASDSSQLDSMGGRHVKPKRKRATHQQVDKLNKVFEHTFFPSSELRMSLAMELGMTPRTVQIWFQNKRQGWRSEHNRSVPRDTSMKPLKLEDILPEKKNKE